MLINETKSASAERAERIAKMMGGDQWNAPWPLPNLKPSTETEFWGWRACWSFDAEVWAGQKKINDEWANLLIYVVDHAHFIDGGFAVAVFRSYGAERIEYFTWRACDHDFVAKTTGNCQRRYTCKKCRKHYDEDSSG